MKTILVPTDFSKNANNALNYAIELGKKENAKIILIHAFHISYIYPDVPIQYLNEKILSSEQIANNKLKLLCDKVETSGKLKCEFISRESSVVDFVVETVKKKKPDLIVMGTKGENGINKLFLGSNTANVIDKAKCPVMAIPEKATFTPIKNITYATDYFKSDLKAIEEIIDLAKLFKSRITILHVGFDVYTHEAEEEFMNIFKRKVLNEITYPKMTFKIVYGNNLINVLEDYIKRESPDLLSMSTDYKNIYDKFFGTNSTKKMTYHTKVPLLAFHYKQESVIFN